MKALFSGETRPDFANTNTVNGLIEQAARPLTPDYRTAPITEGFDWPSILDAVADKRGLSGAPLYLVVFRSVRRPGADGQLIATLDTAAHAEAEQSAALLHYFAGDLDADDRAMSWCLWTDAQSARDALKGEAHRLAVSYANSLYEPFFVEMFNLHLPGDRQLAFEPIHHG